VRIAVVRSSEEADLRGYSVILVVGHGELLSATNERQEVKVNKVDIFQRKQIWSQIAVRSKHRTGLIAE
jgi:hypothetical protein